MKTKDKDKLLEFLRIIPARTLVAIAQRLYKKVDVSTYTYFCISMDTAKADHQKGPPHSTGLWTESGQPGGHSPKNLVILALSKPANC